ncbi:MAG: CehA/McbA family metallohydrolase [Puniceicoccaceae bacterium]
MTPLSRLSVFSLILTSVVGPVFAGQWYRGNTHAHTEICGHADSTPEAVARWYLDHGYHFLVLSEHNHFIDPATVELPDPRRKDFILIPGEEVTGKKTIHTTALNIGALVPWDFDHDEKWRIIQNHVDGIRHESGHPIINHPNYKYAVGADDLLPVKGLHMLELYNGHPAVKNFGDEEHPSIEEMWDQLLSAGMMIYGVASDDMHELKTIQPDKSNPGRGWVMVKASELTPDAISEAMAEGAFYSSSGVFLKKCGVKDGAYVIEVDEEATVGELAQSVNVWAYRVHEGEEGFEIAFIGPNGAVLASSRGNFATFTLDPSIPYVRPKITFTRRYPEHGFEQYFAWGQPVFMDGRD